MVFSAMRPQAFDGLRAGVSDAFSPALSAVSAPFQYTANVLRDVTGLATLQADNLRLAQENERLREWYHTALLLESENKSLRDLLNVKIDPGYEHMSARPETLYGAGIASNYQGQGLKLAKQFRSA